MGIVYLAEDINLHRDVAIKMMTPSAEMSEDYLRRFRREAQAVASLSHPNIVHINAFEVVDGQFIIEMPLMPGGSLRDAIVKGITIGGFVRILGDVLSALSACHEAGIVHRDVKPSNLLLTSAGRGMLTDFGVATLMDGEWQASITGTSSAMFLGGTPQYVSPGAWNGEPPAPHHDLYSLGIVAHEVFLGKSPFSGNSPFELMREISEGNLPPLHEKAPQLSPAFVSLVEQLVRSDGDSSSQTTLEALKATPEWNLAEDREQDTVQFASKPPPRPLATNGPVAPAHTAAIRWRAASLVLGALVAVLLFALAWRGGGARRQPSQEAQPTVLKRSQELAFHDSPVSAEELISLWSRPASGAARVFLAAGSLSPGEAYPVLLLESEGGAYSASGFTDRSIWGVDLTPEGDGQFSAVGTWAAYETAGATAFRWAKVSGTATWSGESGAPLWLAMDVESQSDGARWTEHVVLTMPTDEITDTSFLAALASTPFALPIIYNELPARRLSEPWDFTALLPPVHDARLSAAAIQPDSSITIDGQLSEAAWADSGPERVYVGRPRPRGATLRAVHDGEHLYLALRATGNLAHWRIRVAFLERPTMPMSDARWEKATLEGSGGAFEFSRDGGLAPMADGWPWAPEESQDGLVVEMAIPLRNELLPTSMASRVVHVNVTLSSIAEDGADIPVVTWGWPAVDNVALGTAVYLEALGQP